jgi:3-hydroxybutyryl-CoA dehydrogenase
MMTEINKVLVVGAGIMGHGIAQTFAMNEVPVFLADINDELLQRAKSWTVDNLNTMVDLGEIEKDRVQTILSRIRFTTDSKAAAMEADFVLEAVNENLDLKKKLFRQFGQWTRPDAVIATNSSSFDINDLSPVTDHPERIIGAHWFHPPHITPCVEIIPAKTTNPETIDAASGLMRRIGKVPTLCKSAPGFVANRIQFAMAAEALALIEEGLATPEEIDRIMESSIGFRLGAFGPIKIIDQAGLDTYVSVYQYLYEKLNKEHFKPPHILEKLVAEGHLGLKSQSGFYEYGPGAVEAMKRERDRRLFGRLRLFREERKGEKI